MPTDSTSAADEALLSAAKTFQRIKSRLRDQLGKRWAVGTQLPPIPQLARQLKAGHTNTYRAVKELVKDGLLTSRTGRGTYVTSLADPSRQLLTPGTLSGARIKAPGAHAGVAAQVLVGAAEPDLFIRRAVDAFSEIVRADGCEVTTNVYDVDHRQPLAAFTRARVLMVVNPSAQQMLACGPNQLLVVINTAPETTIAMTGGYDVVSADDAQGGLIAGKHLRDIGCKTVAFLGCAPLAPDGSGQRRYDPTSSLRLAGFEMGWLDSIPPQWRLIAHSYVTIEGASAVQQFLQLDPRPHAIFAASDDIAIGFIHGALAHGLEAGRDYQIVGYDAQERGQHLPGGGKLTSVEVPMAEMGRLAGELLLARLVQPDRRPTRVSLGCSLICGTTTKRNL